MKLQVKAAPATVAFSASRRKRQVTRIPLPVPPPSSCPELSQIYQREKSFSPENMSEFYSIMLTLEVSTSLTFDSHSIARDLEITIKLFASGIYVEITSRKGVRKPVRYLVCFSKSYISHTEIFFSLSAMILLFDCIIQSITAVMSNR